jgi:hypothetical protein
MRLKNKKPKKTKLFRLVPKQVNGKSMINQLTSDYGIAVGKTKTFKTPLIDSTTITNYNGFQFHLSLDGDRVYLKVISDKKVTTPTFWEIEDIYLRMKSKNPTQKVIKPEFVKELISKGFLKVKFVVGWEKEKNKIKDHGTEWKVIIVDDDEEIIPQKIIKPTYSDPEDDFFFDL